MPNTTEAGHISHLESLGIDDGFMVTTHSPRVPLGRLLVEADRDYGRTYKERLKYVRVISDENVHHAHELFQQRPRLLTSLLRMRLTSGGSVMAGFHPGMIRYLVKNLQHESAEIFYDQGLSKRIPSPDPRKESAGVRAY